MTEYHNEELRLINQMLLAIFLITDFAYFLFLHNSPFPWFALAGTAIGLAIIVFCWSGTKYLLFNIMLLLSAAVFSLAYNWSSIF
ncbi:hypothetical protein [Planococcus glaciei]|uniref:hypothetical protein n=1 Tax=Planococcus glaciei TaxID=459472 RepID=UPI0015880115|nr:hypothetical protein [Planococcus glaciei]